MSSYERRAISRSHDRSIQENADISCLSDTQWSVPSSSDPEELYIVERNTNTKLGQCRLCEKTGLFCTSCRPNICVHSYSCTCPDYLINDNICKHIHRIAMATTNTNIRHKNVVYGLRRMNSSQYHREGVENDVEITNINNFMWLIPSFSDVNKVYVVEKNRKNDENCGCTERCELCNICVHTFSCTCPNFVAATNICKHIHKVAWKTVERRSSDSDSDKSTGSWAEFAWTKLTSIERRHERSVEAQVDVSKISESKWLVPSFTDANIVYTVEKNAILNCIHCKRKDRCNNCDICVHSYTCTCPDHDDNSCICKHIHKVAALKNNEFLSNIAEMNSA